MITIVRHPLLIISAAFGVCLAGVVARRLLDKAAERLALPIEMGRLAP